MEDYKKTTYSDYYKQNYQIERQEKIFNTYLNDVNEIKQKSVKNSK